MKTIFSYLSRCLLVYTISFALLQVQVLLPIQSLKYSVGYVQAETETEADPRDSIGVDDDGVAYSKSNLTLDKVDENGLDISVDILSAFLMGWFTSRTVMICKPVPMDVMIAAAGGVIFMGAELFAFNAFKDIRDSHVEEIKNRQDGENADQVTSLQDQKKSYDDIAETAKTKYTTQMAATAAYGVAAIAALYAKIKWYMADMGCAVCPVVALPLASAIALRESPGPSVPTGSSLYSVCAAVAAAWVAGESAVITTVACSAAALGCSGVKISCATDVAICLPAEASVVGIDEKPNVYQKFAQNNLKLPSFSGMFDEEMLTETLEETQVESITSKYGVQRFIDASNPLYALSKSLEIDNENYETQINSYAESRDRMRFYKGELSSSTYEQFEVFREGVIDQALGSDSFSFGEALQLALNNGVDFFIPSANANSVATMLGSILGIVLALFATTSKFLDSFMATPGYRAIAWTLGTTLAGYAASKTKEIQETAEENSAKIQKIIDNLNNINKLSTDTYSGTNHIIPTKIPYPSVGNDEIPLGPEPTPCPQHNASTNCDSLVTGIQNSHGFSGMGGTVGSFATDAAAAADGFSGTKTVPTIAVDKTFNLAKDNEAIQKKLRLMQRKLNDQYKKDGKQPIDFDNLNKNMLAKMRKKTRNHLSKSGMTPNQILSSLGSGSKEKKKEEVAIKGPSKAKETTSGVAAKAKKAPVFSLDLGDSEDSGLSLDDIDANQNAVNALNEESTDDIVTNKGVSIFKVISVRYLKSGFSRLLEEEKEVKKTSK